MRKRIWDTKHTGFVSLVALVVSERWHNDNNDKRSSSVTVIDSYQHANATYPAEYLYGVNACRRICYKDEILVEEQDYLLRAKFDQYNNMHED